MEFRCRDSDTDSAFGAGHFDCKRVRARFIWLVYYVDITIRIWGGGVGFWVAECIDST